MSDVTVIEDIFCTPRVFLPVIHYAGAEEADRAISVALDHGAHGVWLINQGINSKGALAFAFEQKRRRPTAWVGLNLLGIDLTRVLSLLRSSGLNGVWTDGCGVGWDGRGAVIDDSGVLAARQKGTNPWNPLHFGGVAFKGSAPVPPAGLGPCARAAADAVDVVTTSGGATGVAADPGKLRAMREALGPAASLALASGVSVGNVGEYLPYVDAFLVASSIEESFGVLDPNKTRALADAIRSYGRSGSGT